MSYRNQKLSKHSGLWRVDAIGSFQVQREKLRLSVPVYFTRLNKAYKETPYAPNGSMDECLQILVHPAAIYYFKVGTVWEDGSLVHRLPPINNDFAINTSEARCISFNKKLRLNDVWTDTLISTNSLNFGDNKRIIYNNTLFVIVPTVNNTNVNWLIIPCSELLRFYIGISKRLITCAIDGSYNKYIDSNKSYLKDRVQYLYLKTNNIKFDEYKVFSRIESSIIAKHNFNEIHQNLVKIDAKNRDNLANDPLLLRCRFPFVDITHLKVSGNRILLYSNKERQEWGVFTTEIFECSYPFDFDEIILDADHYYSKKKENINPNSSELLTVNIQQLNQHNYSNEEELFNDYTDAEMSKLAIRDYSDRFHAFSNIKITNKKNDVLSMDSDHSQPDFNTDGVKLRLDNDNYTQGDKKNLGVDVFPESSKTKPSRELVLFIGMLSNLQDYLEKYNLKILTRKLYDKGVIEGQEWITFFPDNVWSTRRQWHRISCVNDGELHYRPRQVVCAEVTNEDRGFFFYLMEMELTETDGAQCSLMFFLKNHVQLSDKLLNDILILTAIQNRWPANHNKWKHRKEQELADQVFGSIQTIRIQHPRVLDGNFIQDNLLSKKWAEKIYDQLINTLIKSS